VLERVVDDAADVLVLEPVDHPLAVALADHQPRPAKVPEVMRERALLDVELIAESADVCRALLVEAREHGEAHWMRHAGQQIDSALQDKRTSLFGHDHLT